MQQAPTPTGEALTSVAIISHPTVTTAACGITDAHARGHARYHEDEGQTIIHLLLNRRTLHEFRGELQSNPRWAAGDKLG